MVTNNMIVNPNGGTDPERRAVLAFSVLGALRHAVASFGKHVDIPVPATHEAVLRAIDAAQS